MLWLSLSMAPRGGWALCPAVSAGCVGKQTQRHTQHQLHTNRTTRTAAPTHTDATTHRQCEKLSLCPVPLGVATGLGAMGDAVGGRSAILPRRSGRLGKLQTRQLQGSECEYTSVSRWPPPRKFKFMSFAWTSHFPLTVTAKFEVLIAR